MPKLNVGIIGLGGMGQTMLTDMEVHDKFAVSVAWDQNDRACMAVQTRNPGLRLAANAHELIFDGTLDVLYIASPPNSHRDYFLAAINAGISVFCEKPFGVNIAESEDLLAQIKRAGLANVINFNHGNALGSTHIENQLRSGVMGEIAGVDVFIHLDKWPRKFQENAKWLARRDQGGFTREMLSHWFYLTRRLLGEGTIIRAHVTYPDDGISAETALTAELDFSGVPLFIKAATGGVGPIGTEFTIWGSNTSFRLHSGGRISSSEGGKWVEEFTDMEDIGTGDRMRNLDAAAACFSGVPSTMPDAEVGFAVQKMIESILQNGKV